MDRRENLYRGTLIYGSPQGGESSAEWGLDTAALTGVAELGGIS
jgi:hypothetical protein